MKASGTTPFLALMKWLLTVAATTATALLVLKFLIRTPHAEQLKTVPASSMNQLDSAIPGTRLLPPRGGQYLPSGNARPQTDNAAPPPTRPDPDPDRVYKPHREAIELHRRERLDPVWGPPMKEGVESLILDTLARRKIAADLVNTDCRSSTCTVGLRWKDYDAALAEYRKLMVMPIPCEKSLMLPPPPGGDEKKVYEATMLIKCDPGVGASNLILPTDDLSTEK